MQAATTRPIDWSTIPTHVGEPRSAGQDPFFCPSDVVGAPISATALVHPGPPARDGGLWGRRIAFGLIVGGIVGVLAAGIADFVVHYLKAHGERGLRTDEIDPLVGLAVALIVGIVVALRQKAKDTRKREVCTVVGRDGFAIATRTQGDANPSWSLAIRYSDLPRGFFRRTHVTTMRDGRVWGSRDVRRIHMSGPSASFEYSDASYRTEFRLNGAWVPEIEWLGVFAVAVETPAQDYWVPRILADLQRNGWARFDFEVAGSTTPGTLTVGPGRMEVQRPGAEVWAMTSEQVASLDVKKGEILVTLRDGSTHKIVEVGSLSQPIAFLACAEACRFRFGAKETVGQDAAS